MFGVCGHGEGQGEMETNLQIYSNRRDRGIKDSLTRSLSFSPLARNITIESGQEKTRFEDKLLFDRRGAIPKQSGVIRVVNRLVSKSLVLTKIRGLLFMYPKFAILLIGTI